MKDSPGQKIFIAETSMRNKLWLGFLLVVAAIISTNLIVGIFITNLAWNRFLSTIIGLIMGILLGYIISYYLLKSIRSFLSATRNIGQGDLTQEIPIISNDEIGELARGFNQMVANLREMIIQFKKSSEDIFVASETISSSIQE
ncbi:MAG: HAMP domain-containing protein, partial [Desulfobacterota bacterium]|nr:HAMP domain-containing protein [Thermodesulfobacteriota bacterium]